MGAVLGGEEGGGGALSPAPASIPALAAEGAADAPVLLLSTPGCDPSRELCEGAAAAGAAYSEFALGGDGGEGALRCVRDAAAAGGWACLKNAHLVTGWLPALEAALRALPPPARGFQLWLIGEGHAGWPRSLLARCVVAAVEVPPGVRANVARTYEAWGGGGALPPPASALTPAAPARPQLLHLLAWLHATLQERRAYVPQGWTQPYAFSTADLRAGVAVVDAALAAGGGGGGPPPWAFLLGLLEATVYGGRVDAGADKRVLRACLAAALHNDVLSGARPPAPGAPPCPPPGAPPAAFAAAADALPAVDAPALLGLPANVDRAMQRAAVGALVASLKVLRGGSGGGGGGGGGAGDGGGDGATRHVTAAALRPLLELWDTLAGATPGFLPRDGEECDAACGDATESPLAPVLRAEAASSRALVALVSGDVAALRVAYGGGGGGGGAQEAPGVAGAAAALAADALPAAWEAAWPEATGSGAGGVGAWMRAVASRRRAAVARGVSGAAGAAAAAAALLAPCAPATRLSIFFSPRALLTALRQASARALAAAGVPDAGIATLRLVAAWGEHTGALLAPVVAAAGGAALPTLRVGGLCLQGGAWDGVRGVLVDAPADAPEAVPLPEVTLAWAPPGAPDPLPAAATVTLPLFAGGDRAKPLAELPVPTGAAAGSGAAAAAGSAAERNKWALAGAALLVGEAEL